MFRLTVVEGNQQGQQTEVTQFPFVVGKNLQAQLRLSDAGVWEDHVAIELPKKSAPIVKRLGEGLMSVNADPANEAPLRNGDLITIGGAVLRFELGSVQQKSLLFQNSASWTIVVIVLIVELFLMSLLLGG